MDLTPTTLWWMGAGALVALELATGTVYLLMLSLGCVAGALASHAGLGGSLQLVVAAGVGSGSTFFWHLWRRRSPRAAPASANRDVNLDIGETVLVESWNPDGSTRVKYRGAAWSARFAGGGAPAPGAHLIVAVEGNRLSLAPAQT